MSRRQAEVSLILCGYNAETTMETTLDSAAAQTLDALEILCVNDGSTDRTLDIFRSYAARDSRFKVIDHPANKGLLAARRTGVDNASGKYVMFLDLDDALVPEACAELARRMDETGDDLIQFDTSLVFVSEEDRQKREKEVEQYFSTKRAKPLNGSDRIVEACFLKNEFPWNVWSKIYRTELARRVYSHVPDDMKVVMAEDTFAFFLAATMAERLSFADRKYYVYSVGAGVSGSTDLGKAERSLEVYDALIRPYAEKLSSPVARRAAEKLGRHFRLCVAYKLLTSETTESYKETVDREVRVCGAEQFARTMLENWNLLGMTPLKIAFWGNDAATLPVPARKIRRVGAICLGGELTPSRSALLAALRAAGCEVRLFARNDLVRATGVRATEYPVRLLPEEREQIVTFFDTLRDRDADDAYVVFGGSTPEYDVAAFLLFEMRFVRQRPLFVLLERAAGRLNCHDRIFFGAADCVLGDDPALARLFGDLGVPSGAKGSAARMKRLLAAFSGAGGDEVRAALATRRATVVRALAELGFVGYGGRAAPDRDEVARKLAAAESSLSAEDYVLMRESGFFDDEFYRKQFPGVDIDDAILHFHTVGAAQLAAASAVFDPKAYCIENPDLYPLSVDPVVHYLRHGILEGRKLFSSTYDAIRRSGFFDEKRYRAKHGDELGTWDPLVHYLLVGWKKGYLPSERFVDEYYRDFYLDVESHTISLLGHYVRWGRKEGRCSFPLKPRLEWHFPEGYDAAAFRRRQGKYLIAVHQLDHTGAPILAKMVAEIFRDEGSVAIVSPMDGPLREDCLKAGIPVLIDSDFYLHKTRAAYYKAHGFGVCLFNTLGLTKSFLRVADEIPSVLWIHDNLPASFLPEIVREKMRYAPTIFATSGTTAALVREYNPCVRHLPYPVRDAAGHHKTGVPRRIRFGVMGVYIERKGQDLAIEAFRRLPPELKKNAELLLIGNTVLPEYAEKLEALAEGEKSIRFVPARKDPDAYHRFYEEMEVQICPSRTDPMPLVVCDGMMHGCPLILADTVGQSEFVRDGENGFVFPAEDVAALRECMIRVLKDPSGFERMSRAVRQTFLDRFEFTGAADKIRAALDEAKSYF